MYKIKKSLWIVSMLACALLLAACGSKDKVLPPVEIQEGVDRCEVCLMLISDDRHAVQLRLNDGQALKFDDIGDMFVWTNENGLDDVNVRYVRDYYTEEWLPIEKASFVYDAQFRTPMAFGVYSFANKEGAEQFIADQGKGELLSYEDLQHHHWESAMGHDHHGHDHGHHHDGDHHTDHHDHDQDHHHGDDHGHGHNEHDNHVEHDEHHE